MNRKVIASLTLLVATTTTALLTHADEPKGDLAKLQGTWTTKVGSKKDIQASMIVKDSTIEIKLTRPDNQEITLKGEMKLDEKASPKTADWVKFTGPGGQEIPAIKLIYKLEGDTWTTCSSGPDVERPTKFEGGDGPGMPTLDVWTRAKEKVESPVPKSE